MMPSKLEKLDCIYVCKQCKASFLFFSDMTDHAAMTGHEKDFVHIRFEEWDGAGSISDR